jgi:hypothetical protein
MSETIKIILLGSVSPLAILLIGFLCKQKIRDYFQRGQIELQHSFNAQLEAYRMILLGELEKRKGDIDIEKSMAVEMGHRKVEAYRHMIAGLSHFRGVIYRYNSLPTPELRMVLPFQEDFERATRYAYDLSEYDFFYSEQHREKLHAMGNKLSPILAKTKTGELIDNDLVEQYNEAFKELKRAFKSELLQEVPKA